MEVQYLFSVSGVLLLLKRKISFLHLREVLAYFAFTCWKWKRMSLPASLFVWIVLFKPWALLQAF